MHAASNAQVNMSRKTKSSYKDKIKIKRSCASRRWVQTAPLQTNEH